MNVAIEHLPKREQNRLITLERRRRAAGNWGHWETSDVRGWGSRAGWLAEIRRLYRNAVFTVLERQVANDHTTYATHLAVSSLSGIRPTWHEMQRIKDDLAGPDRTAIEIYPPAAEVIDQADMFHIWVIGGRLPFSLHDDRHLRMAGAAR